MMKKERYANENTSVLLPLLVLHVLHMVFTFWRAGLSEQDRVDQMDNR